MIEIHEHEIICAALADSKYFIGYEAGARRPSSV
jgi:hypothetical protein